MKNGDLDDATRDLKYAIKLAPQDKKLRDEWENLRKLKDENKMKHKNIMVGMFNNKKGEGGIYDEKKMRYVYEKIPDFNPENI